MEYLCVSEIKIDEEKRTLVDRTRLFEQIYEVDIIQNEDLV